MEIEYDLIEKLNMRLDSLYDKEEKTIRMWIESTNEFYDEFLEDIRREIFEIETLIRLKNGPCFTNGILDLYFDYDDSCEDEEYYNITLHNCLVIIGHVRITYSNFCSFLGNIGYELCESSRGNGYMIQALEMLSEVMIDNGLTKPIITVYPDNIPSLKTIEKFGGVLIDGISENKSYVTYEVDLMKKVKKRN